MPPDKGKYQKKPKRHSKGKIKAENSVKRVFGFNFLSAHSSKRTDLVFTLQRCLTELGLHIFQQNVSGFSLMADI